MDFEIVIVEFETAHGYHVFSEGEGEIPDGIGKIGPVKPVGPVGAQEIGAFPFDLVQFLRGGREPVVADTDGEAFRDIAFEE